MRVLALALLLSVSMAEAQVAKPTQSEPAMTPVGVAYTLYTGCITAEFQTITFTARTKSTAQTYLKALDYKCLAWTVVWFKPLLGYEATQLSPASLETFNALRLTAMDRVYSDLAYQYNIK